MVHGHTLKKLGRRQREAYRRRVAYLPHQSYDSIFARVMGMRIMRKPRHGQKKAKPEESVSLRLWSQPLTHKGKEYEIRHDDY
jgi:hypothetical protein